MASQRRAIKRRKAPSGDHDALFDTLDALSGDDHHCSTAGSYGLHSPAAGGGRRGYRGASPPLEAAPLPRRASGGDQCDVQMSDAAEPLPRPVAGGLARAGSASGHDTRRRGARQQAPADGYHAYAPSPRGQVKREQSKAHPVKREASPPAPLHVAARQQRASPVGDGEEAADHRPALSQAPAGAGRDAGFSPTSPSCSPCHPGQQPHASPGGCGAGNYWRPGAGLGAAAVNAPAAAAGAAWSDVSARPAVGSNDMEQVVRKYSVAMQAAGLPFFRHVRRGGTL